MEQETATKNEQRFAGSVKRLSTDVVILDYFQTIIWAMLPFLIFLAPVFLIIMPFRGLAYKYGRHRGGYVFLAIGTYLFLYVFFAFIIGFMMSPMLSPGSDDIDSIDSQQLEIDTWLMVCMAILAALLSVVVLYYRLKSSWKKTPKRDSHPDLLDSK